MFTIFQFKWTHFPYILCTFKKLICIVITFNILQFDYIQFILTPLLILFPLAFSPLYSIRIFASDSIRSAVANTTEIYHLGTVKLCLISNGKDFYKHLHQNSLSEWILQNCWHTPRIRGLVLGERGDSWLYNFKQP